jgi:uncharacterized protein YndB with AHSA1/START domain/DNA-binding transcriptional ArsR family regulator
VDVDAVFKALADRSRRELLDRLNADNGQRLVELCEGLHMTRQAVSRHLAVLEAANLVTTVKRGRDKRHYLNPVPINEIADRWIGRYDRGRVAALADLKHALEDKPVPKPEFVYTTYIRSTPEQVWQALTEPAFTVRYWGEALKSDWKIGSPVLYKTHGSDEYHDLGEVVLEYAPYRRLAYTWHNYQPEHKAIYGWTDERFAELVKEPQSKVAFELETHGDGTVKLTVIHDGFETETEMLKGVSQGWPQILASLKSLLESGEPLTWPEWEHLREATSRSS